MSLGAFRCCGSPPAPILLCSVWTHSTLSVCSNLGPWLILILARLLLVFPCSAHTLVMRVQSRKDIFLLLFGVPRVRLLDCRHRCVVAWCTRPDVSRRAAPGLGMLSTRHGALVAGAAGHGLAWVCVRSSALAAGTCPLTGVAVPRVEWWQRTLQLQDPAGFPLHP